MTNLRLLVYDGTSPTPRARASERLGEHGLRAAWSAGARLYRALGRIDAHYGATSWSGALDWLAGFRPGEPVAEIQYWGHGKWGKLFIASDVLTAAAFEPDHPHRAALDALRLRLLPRAGSLLWFRTCGATARARARSPRACPRSSGRGRRGTVIGALSGLHGIRGAAPHWSADEGLSRGTADAPPERTARRSAP